MYVRAWRLVGAMHEQCQALQISWNITHPCYIIILTIYFILTLCCHSRQYNYSWMLIPVSLCAITRTRTHTPSIQIKPNPPNHVHCTQKKCNSFHMHCNWSSARKKLKPIYPGQVTAQHLNQGGVFAYKEHQMQRDENNPSTHLFIDERIKLSA